MLLKTDTKSFALFTVRRFRRQLWMKSKVHQVLSIVLVDFAAACKRVATYEYIDYIVTKAKHMTMQMSSQKQGAFNW